MIRQQQNKGGKQDSTELDEEFYEKKLPVFDLKLENQTIVPWLTGI